MIDISSMSVHCGLYTLRNSSGAMVDGPYGSRAPTATTSPEATRVEETRGRQGLLACRMIQHLLVVQVRAPLRDTVWASRRIRGRAFLNAVPP